MLEIILEKNISFIKNRALFRKYNTEIQHVVNTLNQKRILMLSWLRNIGKTNIVHEFLRKTDSFDTSFYFNTEVDALWNIKNEHDMITLFDIYVRIYGVPKVIILQNTESVAHIKNFITKLIATKKYKILLVWNNIKVEGIPEIECYPLRHTEKSIAEYKYWWIPEVRVIPDLNYKDFILKSLKSDIITKDILEPYNIKNISLHYSVISYISQIDWYHSTREIHRQLELHGIEISLLTLIDYISAWVNTKILKKCYLYDMKADKEISSKVMYYFWDTGIRHSFSGDIPFLLQNTLYLELQSQWYNVYAWKNGRFEFDFYARHKASDICISVDTSWDKNEIRKIARKLAKIWDNSRKYIIVENKNSLTMRKFIEDWVEIVELWDFLFKF